MNRLVGYICYVLLSFTIIYFGIRHQANLHEFSKANYEMLPYYTFSTFFPIVLGVFLSIPHHFKNFNQKGSWRIDWMKLFVIGLPFLLLSMFPLLNLTGGINFTLPFYSSFDNGSLVAFTTITGLISGCAVSTSVRKE